MSGLKKFFEDLEDDDFPAAIQKINAHMYDVLEAQQNKSGGGKVTKEIMSLIKKCHDQINLKLVKAHRECVAAETKLKTIVTDSMAYEALRKRRSGILEQPSERSAVTVLRKKTPPRDEGFSLVVTAKDEETQIPTIREELKRASREDVNFPMLTDAITTKAGQLILKVASKDDSDKLKGIMNTWADRVRVSQPRRRRCRLLVLSTSEDVVDRDVARSVRSILVDGGLAGDRDVEVIRRFNTRQEKFNWLIDVDVESAGYLLDRRRICINLERYRIVEHIQILRCYRCQKFGHPIAKCPGVQKCPKCAGEHSLKDCSSDNEMCANCIEDEEQDATHRADSSSCPCFKTYRDGLITARRL